MTTPPPPERSDQARPEVTHYEARLDAELVEPPNARARLLAYVDQQESKSARVEELGRALAYEKKRTICPSCVNGAERIAELEKRAGTAEREVVRLGELLRVVNERVKQSLMVEDMAIERARRDGYERGSSCLVKLEAWLREHPWRDIKIHMVPGVGPDTHYPKKPHPENYNVHLWSCRPVEEPNLAAAIGQALGVFAQENQRDPR